MKYLFYLSIVRTGCKQETTGNRQAGATRESSDPLSSWSDGRVKQSIKTFVGKCTDSSSDTVVPLVHRMRHLIMMASYGLKSLYTRAFCLLCAKQMVSGNPERARTQPFIVVLNHEVVVVSMNRTGNKYVIT
ncbi:hypothetical protein ACX0G7_12230 [Flavitalea antarctica]